VLRVLNLTKEYEMTLAVNNVSFEVCDGEIAILLGPNGAGKSTTIKCITGLLKYTGKIEICGEPNKGIKAKRMFSYVPETPALYEMLTVYEHMEFIGNAYGVKNYKEKAEALLERFELADKRNKLGKEYLKECSRKLVYAAHFCPTLKLFFSMNLWLVLILKP